MFAILASLIVPLQWAATPPSGIAYNFISGFCSGSTSSTGVSSGGVIPASSIGSTYIGGSSILGIILLIMLTVLMALGILYMIASATTIEGLKTVVKSELLELAATAIILTIFVGGIYASVLSMATQGSALQYAVPPDAGTSTYPPVSIRNVFVADCEMLSQSSVGMILPLFAIGIVNLGVRTAQTVNFKISTGAGTNFGFSDSLLSGISLTGNIIGQLRSMMSVMIILVFSVLFSLGFIYTLFPILLYIGIILRAIPWTRPLGGMLVALFIGYFMLFPVLLMVTLNGFNQIQVNVSPIGYSSTSTLPTDTISGFTGALNSATTGSQAESTIFYLLSDTLTSMFGLSHYGIINGFIYSFIEPSFFTILDIMIAFIISFDFMDILADLLGAPSMSSERLVGKLWLTK